MTTQRSHPELDRLRQEIDAIDAGLLGLLAQRFQVTAQVGQVKAEADLSAVDEQRERAQLARLRAKAGEMGLAPEFVAQLWRLVFAEAVRRYDEDAVTRLQQPAVNPPTAPRVGAESRRQVGEEKD
ncbi:MAG: chorismate mutase [Arachnia propionica]|nr:MAG: chorismate mutase [Arachnia propionica]